MVALNQGRQLRRELTSAQRIPYAAHVSEHVVKTVFGDYVQVFRLGGASFESADDEQLNGWHERLNVLWRNVASPQWALWTHVVRRRATLAVAGDADEVGFAARLRSAYLARLTRETLMVNELYVTTVYRPVAGPAVGPLSRLFDRSQRQAGLVLADAIEACDKLAQTLEAALARYEPERLRVYGAQGQRRSQVLEFLSLLINGEGHGVGLPRGPLNEALATSRLVFGTEVIEYRMPTASRLGAMLGIKEYPTPSVVGMLNRLLSAPFSFVLTQSFAFLTKAAAQGLLQRQFNRLLNVGDFAHSQAEELKAALDALTSNEFVMGDHHCSLQVLVDDLGAGEPGGAGRRMKALNDQVALARAHLADTGMIVAREDLALEAAFWAQLPGHFSMRTRKAPITSRNFAALMPFHNYPLGRPHGNHWGEALTTLITSARSPYYFSLHASDPADPEGGSRKDTGHTFICGPTGSGKTVFVAFMVAMLTQRHATQVIFDKDHGLEILVRAMGGVYLPLRHGEPTGFNPLQLPIDAEHIEFLKAWLRVLARRPGRAELTTREEADLDQALRGTLALDPALRRLSRLIEFLDATEPEGPYARLSKWCEVTRGDYAWVFDQPRDRMAARIEGQTLVGFDVTAFLSHEVIRTPVTLYLFHLVRRLLDGRRFVCWIDEFWRLLADPAFEGFAKDGPKTWRKLNAVMCLATQGAGDVLQSPISRTIIEQTPTKVFFPNGDASLTEYVEGFGLTEREFKLIKEQLEPGSRQFLVKQGHHSVVCELDLKGFEGELRVMSGRNVEVQRMRRLIAAHGADPQCWLHRFMTPDDESAS